MSETIHARPPKPTPRSLRTSHPHWPPKLQSPDILQWPRLSTRRLSRQRRRQSGGSAEAAASRLLKKVKPIMDRVRELQAELAKHTAESREKCVAELNELRRDAHAEKAYGAAVSAVMGKAKILNFITDQVDANQQVDFNSAQSMSDIGRKLLQSIGFKEPDDVSIQAAIELNDTFIDGLQQIHQRAQGFTLDQDEE